MLVSSVNVDDGAWHTATCWRANSAVGVTLDGVQRSVTCSPGSIANTKNLTLANKKGTAGASDQLFGRIDFVTWVTDPAACAIVRRAGGELRLSAA